MASRCIASLGGYLPLLRLDRGAAAAALRWSGLGGPKKGFRAVAGWDEDAVTLAVEAGRAAGGGRTDVQDLVFASTSAPFFERAHAPLLIHALGLPETTRSTDVAGSRRAGTSALLSALEGRRDTLVAAGEARTTRVGSAAQLSWGDGGAAAIVRDAGPLAYLGGASISHDLVDTYSSRDHPTPYPAEERFVRDIAVSDVLVPTIQAALAKAGVTPEQVAFVAMAEPASGAYAVLAKTLGLTAPNVGTDVAEQAGDLGAAHPLFALALACDRAGVGNVILLVGFGSGCDALLFQMNGPVPGASTAASALTEGRATKDYVRFLSLSGGIDLDWGVRAETVQKAAATVQNRHGRDMLGFVGGRDARGNVQFPKTPMPVHPDATGAEILEDVRLADVPATLVSVTADRLNFSPDPPFHFGLAQFDNGARVMMELTDAGPNGFAVGDTLSMRFRIKSLDRKRGFRTWFWKAAPAARSALET